jgi:hypothetical protein
MRHGDLSSSLRGRRPRQKNGLRVSRYLSEPVNRTFAGLRCRHQLFSDKAAHLMAAAMFCLDAYLVEHIFEACLKSRANFTHDVIRSLARDSQSANR